MGHEVQVLTGFPNYPSGALYPGYRLRLCQRETVGGIPVTRVALYPEHSRSAIKRALNYVSFAASATILGPWLMRRPDVIFVFSTPYTIGIPARWMSLLWRAPFVFNVQDLWPETLGATGMLHNRHALAFVGWFADWIYRRAAAIIVISPGFRQNLVKKGVPETKIHVVSNWVDIDHYCPVAADTGLGAHLNLDGRFNVMFAGGMGKAQGLDTVMRAAELLRSNSRIQFVFVGSGVEAPHLRAMAANLGLDNVRFLGQYPEASMPAILALADVMLVHLRDDPLFRITVPHKIFTYAASGKPILCAVSGDAAELVKAIGGGLACPPGDPTALAAAVQEFYELPEQDRRDMGERGRKAAVELYSQPVLVAQIANILEAVAAKRLHLASKAVDHLTP